MLDSGNPDTVHLLEIKIAFGIFGNRKWKPKSLIIDLACALKSAISRLGPFAENIVLALFHVQRFLDR